MASVAPRAALGRETRLHKRVDLRRLSTVVASEPSAAPSQREPAATSIPSETSRAESPAAASQGARTAGAAPAARTKQPAQQAPAAAPSPGPSDDTEGAAPKGAAQAGDDEPQLIKGSKDINWGRQITVTIVWLGVICVAAWLVLRFFYSGSGLSGLGLGRRKLIRILDRQMLSPQKSLMVVEVAGRALLLGVGEHGVQLLTELDGQAVGLSAAQAPAAQGAAVSAEASQVSLPATSSPDSDATSSSTAVTEQQLAAMFGRRQPPEETP